MINEDELIFLCEKNIIIIFKNMNYNDYTNDNDAEYTENH